MSKFHVQQTTCRTCAIHKAKEVYTPLFAGPSSCQNSQKDVLYGIMAFNLKINQDDGLPQQICSKCLEKFKFVVQFRADCQNAQFVLNGIKVPEIPPAGKTSKLEVEGYGTSEQVKSEYLDLKTETLETGALNPLSKIEEIDVKHVDDDDAEWECTYLLDESAEVPKEIVEDIVDKKDAIKPDEMEEDALDGDDDSYADPNYSAGSDAESDDIPLQKYVKKRSSPKKDEHPTKQKIDSSDESDTKSSVLSCKFCGKKCKTQRSMYQHKALCPFWKEVTCTICTMKCDSKEHLAAHREEIHANGDDPCCPRCLTVFPSIKKRDMHIRKKGCISEACKLCNKMFKCKESLTAHMNRKHRDIEYECSICHEKFKKASQYRYHWTHAHVENMKYQCKYCEKPFASQFVMRVHERSHTGERPFLCNQCGSAFRYRTQFLDHMKMHDNERNIPCDQCGQTFYTNRQLANHKRKHVIKNHVCDICNEAFPYKLDLYAHKYNVHKIAEYNPKRQVDCPFKCPQCSKGFSVLTSLTKHLKIHTEADRKHVCPHCGNGYKRSDHLKLHIKRMHLKIRDFKCEVCGREYLERCALKAHMVVHNSARPFACHKCPVAFKRQRSLRDHLLKHDGVKEYACGICDMKFFNRTIVVLHTKRVHSDSQKQFMSELVRKEFEETIKGPDNADFMNDMNIIDV